MNRVTINIENLDDGGVLVTPAKVTGTSPAEVIAAEILDVLWKRIEALKITQLDAGRRKV